VWHSQGAKVAKVAVHHLKEKARTIGGLGAQSAGTIQGKEGGMQVLAGLAPSSQTVGSNKRVIHEQAKHSSWMTEANITLTLVAKLGEGRRGSYLAAKLGEGKGALARCQWLDTKHSPVDPVDQLTSMSWHLLACRWVDTVNELGHPWVGCRWIPTSPSSR